MSENDGSRREPRQSDEGARVVRVLARAAVVPGGLFWAVAAFSAPHVFDDVGALDSAKMAVWPILAAVVILAVGWANEQIAAMLLLNASIAGVVWGAIYEWELGVWILMSLVLMVPMAAAAFLFLIASGADARRTARERTAPEPEVHRPEVEVALPSAFSGAGGR